MGKMHYLTVLTIEVLYAVFFSGVVIELVWTVLTNSVAQKAELTVCIVGLAYWRVYRWARYRIAWHLEDAYFMNGYPKQLCSFIGLTSAFWKGPKEHMQDAWRKVKPNLRAWQSNASEAESLIPSGTADAEEDRVSAR